MGVNGSSSVTSPQVVAFYKKLLDADTIDVSEIPNQAALTRVVDGNKGVRDYVRGVTGWKATLMDPLYSGVLELIQSRHPITDEQLEEEASLPAYEKKQPSKTPEPFHIVEIYE